MSEEKKQHLEFLQNTIIRMNSNSFQIKSLAITLLTALIAVYASNQKVVFIFISLVPTVILSLLDSYYLQQERKFRGIYDDIAGIKSVNIVKDYEMPLDKYKGNGFSFSESFWSRTIVLFYLPILLITLFVVLLILLLKL
jgi:hypothetical protein